MKVLRVFLVTMTVPYRVPAGTNPFTYRETRPLRHRAKWITRGTSTDLYVSKNSPTQEEAVRLALAWLTRENKDEVRYVDTTDHPGRFGYSHEGAASTDKKSPAQLDAEIAEALSKDLRS